MRINQNISAYNAHRNLSITDTALSKSLEKLSSGLRINRAADDAAGLSISEKLRGQVRGITQASRNAQDGISLIQTAEGALNESHSILQRIRVLSVQAANGAMTDSDRAAIQQEVSALVQEVDTISNNTTYNTMKLINGGLGSSIENVGGELIAASGIQNIESMGAATGTYQLSFASGTNTLTLSGGGTTQSIVITPPTGFNTNTYNFGDIGVRVTVNNAISGTEIETGESSQFDVSGGQLTLQVGANQGETMSVTINSMSAAGLGIDTVDVSTQAGAQAAIASLDTAVDSVSDMRSRLGAVQNRLEHTIANLGVAGENLTASEARIRDVDMAAEVMTFTRNQIMMQAGTAMLAQANAVPQTVLQLLM